eukprot:Phypoly_transcript_25502.p1 GENE.Phypoly_transcript_25502~~Phypoly_transcript_25502.p1  ORF type:complete len:135 (+),score=14.23 Phypoly_transcript_25502:59-463(+)
MEQLFTTPSPSSLIALSHLYDPSLSFREHYKHIKHQSTYCTLTLKPKRPTEERLVWEYEELFKAINLLQGKINLNMEENWENFHKKKIRSTGSDVLDFGAYLLAVYNEKWPAGSYYHLYPQTFNKFVDYVHMDL